MSKNLKIHKIDPSLCPMPDGYKGNGRMCVYGVRTVVSEVLSIHSTWTEQSMC